MTQLRSLTRDLQRPVQVRSWSLTWHQSSVSDQPDHRPFIAANLFGRDEAGGDRVYAQALLDTPGFPAIPDPVHLGNFHALMASSAGLVLSRAYDEELRVVATDE